MNRQASICRTSDLPAGIADLAFLSSVSPAVSYFRLEKFYPSKLLILNNSKLIAVGGRCKKGVTFYKRLFNP